MDNDKLVLRCCDWPTYPNGRKITLREMTNSEMRELLKPYGTPFRSSMKRVDLQRHIQKIMENERKQEVA